jgi:hypothetical protein
MTSEILNSPRTPFFPAWMKYTMAGSEYETEFERVADTVRWILLIYTR